MKYEELIILLPCHSLEDFPLHHTGDDAQSLLANWTALWHPALLAAAEKMPSWHRVDDPPEQLANRLIVIPTVSMNELQTGFVQRAKGDGACLVRKKLDREEIIAAALQDLDGGDQGVSREFVDDFLALGYCYLQVELLTRQMRYASNLDEVHFSNQVVGAALAIVQGNETEAREKLQACFDVLAEERDHYYPVDAFLLDLTLVAPTTIGQSLREEFAAPVPINLLLAASVVSEIAEHEPDSLSALKAGIEAQRIGLLGGESIERRLPLLSYESLLGEFKRGLAEYERHLGARPLVFGRRRFGLTPTLPQILHKLGFTGALHATLDDGRFPEGIQIKTRWEGSDGAAVDALTRPPLDATKPESYLNLAVKMGESMDMDHVATVCFAHWPSQTSPWYDDLRRIARYSSALGKFVTIDEYFRNTDSTGQIDRFTADQYRSPYLKQAIVRRHEDPISTSVRYWQRRAAVDAAQTLSSLAALVSGDAGTAHQALIDLVDGASEDADSAKVDAQLDEAVSQATEQFASALPRKTDKEVSGYLVANPCSFVRRIGVDISALPDLPAIGKPIYSAAESGEYKHAVVDVPPMGFAWVTPSGKAAKQRRPPKPMVEDRTERDGIVVIHNEFFEAIIDFTTGSLRSIHEYSSRGNRLSQQLALRLPTDKPRTGDRWSDPDQSAQYSVMRAETVEVSVATPTLGEITTKGQLVDLEGQTLAGFQQTYQLWRGSRVLRIEIELDPQEEPRADPWNSYYAARFAWADETADLWRTVNQTRHAVSNKRFESPHYIEIEDEKKRTTILTGGLPFHRRDGHRGLDCLLVVRGERQRKFRIGVGIDLTHPMQEAMSLLMPNTTVAQTAAGVSPSDSSWLFHIDAKNVIATHWEPLVDEGAVAGYRVRLLETTGRPARATVSGFREVSEARQVDFLGSSLGECKLDKGRVRCELSAHEWVEIEARF